MKLLLVEHNELDAHDIVGLLASGCEDGVSVRHVSTCAAALEALQSQHYDVVLVDLALPDTDGAETIMRINQTHAGCPLIVLSGTDNLDLAVDLVRLGVQDYLVKGQIHVDSLRRAIRYAIQRKHNERRLEFLAGNDQLTGLMNRQRLRMTAEHALANADRRGGRAALLFIDLDHFKAVNDQLGHAAGDELLVSVARRLNNSIRRGDTAARLGGDEFAVLLECVRDPSAAATVAEKIVASLAQPFAIEGHEHRITASIGITIYPDDGRDAGTLLRNADMAMYRAKARGRNMCQFYTEEIAALALRRHEHQVEVRRGLALDQFALHYEPVIDLRDGSVAGLHSYLRWHREDGVHTTMDFRNVVASAGMTTELAQWHFTTVLRQQLEWRRAGTDVVPVTVGGCAQQMATGAYFEALQAALDETGVPAGLIVIEIPDALFARADPALDQWIACMHERGVGLALSAFGSGGLSVDRLRDSPIGAVKISRELVAGIDRTPEEAAVVGSIISLAHNLGKTLIAETVATNSQYACLREAGCELAHGPLFGDPLPARKAAHLLMAPVPVHRGLLGRPDGPLKPVIEGASAQDSAPRMN